MYVCVCAARFTLQVSPDERFDEILGVSDTFIPAANVWVGEYPYLDKVSQATICRANSKGDFVSRDVWLLLYMIENTVHK